MTDLQPRWPAHTPIAPSGHGPGGGRWMPAHAGSGWAQHLSDLVGLVRPDDWHWNRARRPEVLAQIARIHGFDGPPRIGSRSEVDDAIRGGGTEIWRGAHVAPLRGFRSGPYVPGVGTGGHRYGEGYYFSTARDTAEGYAVQGGDAGGGVLRAALLPHAKVVDWEHLTEATDRLRHGSPVDGIDPALGWAMADPGILAAALGYDAIRIRGREDGVHMDAPFPDQYVILNRQAVLAEAEPAADATGTGWAERIAHHLGLPGLPTPDDVVHGADIRLDYQPGQWQAPRPSALLEHSSGTPLEDWRPELVQEMLATLRERQTYTNGHIAVHVEKYVGDGPPGADHRQLLAIVDRLMAVAPIRRPVTITVADPGVQYPSILDHRDSGATIITDGQMWLSRELYDPTHSTGPRGWHTESARDAHPLAAITAHEWGHLLDTVMSEWDREQLHEEHGGAALSRYAAGDPTGVESVAEAFAEWYLTRGRSESEDVQAYAETLGWEWNG